VHNEIVAGRSDDRFRHRITLKTVKAKMMSNSNSNMLLRVIVSLRERAKAISDAVTLVDPPLYR